MNKWQNCMVCSCTTAINRGAGFYTAMNRGATIAMLQLRCLFLPGDKPTLTPKLTLFLYHRDSSRCMILHRDKSQCYNGVVTIGMHVLPRDKTTLTPKPTLYFTAINRSATMALLQSGYLFLPRDKTTLTPKLTLYLYHRDSSQCMILHRDKSRCYKQLKWIKTRNRNSSSWAE